MIRFIKYFFVGGIAALIDWVLFFILIKGFHIPWYFSAIISFTFATLANYVLSINHVFESGVRFQKKQEMALVFLVSLVGLGINQAILWLLISVAKTHLLLSKISATGVVFLWNYMIRHKFVFKETSLCQEK